MNATPTSSAPEGPQNGQTTAGGASLSAAMPGLPALNLEHTLGSQREQLEVYQQLLETLASSEQESAAVFPELSKMLMTHMNTLTQLKGDLHDIFTRIRGLKMHFQAQYPKVFDYVQTLHADAQGSEEDDDEAYHIVDR